MHLKTSRVLVELLKQDLGMKPMEIRAVRNLDTYRHPIEISRANTSTIETNLLNNTKRLRHNTIKVYEPIVFHIVYNADLKNSDVDIQGILHWLSTNSRRAFGPLYLAGSRFRIESSHVPMPYQGLALDERESSQRTKLSLDVLQKGKRENV